MADAQRQSTLSREGSSARGECPEHPAIKAILAWNAEAFTDAKFDRGELTLTVAPGQIRAACCRSSGRRLQLL